MLNFAHKTENVAFFFYIIIYEEVIKINNFAKEITIEELNELDIDLSCISICDKIRKLGKKGDFKINDIWQRV